MAKTTKIYSQSEFDRWVKRWLYPDEKELVLDLDPPVFEEEPLWESEWAPDPRCYSPQIKVLRIDNTNWFLFLDESQFTARWIHLASYVDFLRKVYIHVVPEGDGRPFDFNKVHSLPVIKPAYDDWQTSCQLEYCNFDRAILRDYKYTYGYERPVNPVYALACYIHARVQYLDAGYWSDAEYGDFEYEYNGLPDDLSVLIAHAAIVMCDEKRVDALYEVKKAVGVFKGEHVDCLSYKTLLSSNAIYMA